MPSSAEGTRAGPPLRVLREAKLAGVLAGVLPTARGGNGDPRLEASGVVLARGRLWVAFDNLGVVAGLDPRFASPDPTARLVPVAGDLRDIEDIAHDQESGRFYLVVEGRHTGSGPSQPLVAALDSHWKLLGRKRVDLPLARANKGVEGLECLRRAGRRFLLALSEGNLGLAGKAGRRYGGGRVHVLAETGDRWAVDDTIALPESLRFHDYSAISVAGERVAVVSQESSALWVGRLHPTRWAIMDDGVAHPFPTHASGEPRYPSIEGVAWLDERTLAVVSDRVSGGEAAGRDKDESVHVVELPAS